jgi:hypothetical protein
MVGHSRPSSVASRGRRAVAKRLSEFVMWFSEQFGATPNDFDIMALREKEKSLGLALFEVQSQIRRHDSLMMKWTAALYARNAFAPRPTKPRRRKSSTKGVSK